jgi:hypothetical protein
LVKFPLLLKEGWPGYEFTETQEIFFRDGVVDSKKHYKKFQTFAMWKRRITYLAENILKLIENG